MPLPPEGLPANVIDAMRRGQAIEAVKLLRAATGLGLNEARQRLDRFPRDRPAGVASERPPQMSSSSSATSAAGQNPTSVADALQRGHKLDAIRLMRQNTGMGLREAMDAVQVLLDRQSGQADGLSPGEVPKSKFGPWIAAALVLAALVWIYLHFGRPQ